MSVLTKAEKYKIIAQKMKTPQGRDYIAEQMIRPLRKYRDYVSVGRRAFIVDPLGQGIMPEYELDPDVTAWVIANEAGEFRSIFRDEKVMVDLFVIASAPDIHITKMKRRQYDVETRVKQKANMEIFRTEDRHIFNLFDRITSNESGRYANDVITAPANTATIEQFSLAMSQIEQHGDVKAANMFMNAANMAIVRRLGKDYFTPVTNEEVLKSGYIGNIFNVAVHTSPEIPTDTIYMTCEPEYFGVMPVSFDLTVLAADKPNEIKIGFSIFEEIGTFVQNENGVAKILLT